LWHANDSVCECKLEKWFKKADGAVVVNEPLFEISIKEEKSPVPSPTHGVLRQVLINEGTRARTDSVFALIDAPQADELAPREIARDAKLPDAPGRSAEPRIQLGNPKASPLVRQMALESGIDTAEIRGIGWGGRITRKDEVSHPAQREKLKSSLGQEGSEIASISESAKENYIHEPIPRGKTEPASSNRDAIPGSGTIAECEVAARPISMSICMVCEVDVSNLVHWREQGKIKFEQREGIPLAYTVFLPRPWWRQRWSPLILKSRR